MCKKTSVPTRTHIRARPRDTVCRQWLFLQSTLILLWKFRYCDGVHSPTVAREVRVRRRWDVCVARDQPLAVLKADLGGRRNTWKRSDEASIYLFIAVPPLRLETGAAHAASSPPVPPPPPMLPPPSSAAGTNIMEPPPSPPPHTRTTPLIMKFEATMSFQSKDKWCHADTILIHVLYIAFELNSSVTIAWLVVRHPNNGKKTAI